MLFFSGERLYAVNGPGIGIIEGFTLDRSGNIVETWGPENTVCTPQNGTHK